jgi:hypothetical protein
MRPCPRMVFSPGPVGTKLPRYVLGPRAAATSSVTFALADRGQFFGAVYPAISRDAGRTWRVDGPCFYYSAAQGPNVTSAIGARAPDSAYAWGALGAFIKVTRDGGRHWFAANIPGGMVSVHYRGSTLRALVCGNTSKVFTYDSNDDGLIWRLRGLAPHSQWPTWCVPTT